jgi:hypothetical protein
MKLRIDETYLNIIKATYEKPMPDIILNREKLKSFPLMKKTRISTLPNLTYYSPESPSQSKNYKTLKEKGCK